LRLAKQFRDGLAMTQLKDTFSVMPKEIESTRQFLNGMVLDLSARFPNMKKPEAASHDVKRQPVDSKSHLTPSLFSSEPEFDRHIIGFDNEGEHFRPLKNPLKYAEEQLCAILGLDHST
jgi:hypothetical protein